MKVTSFFIFEPPGDVARSVEWGFKYKKRLGLYVVSVSSRVGWRRASMNAISSMYCYIAHMSEGGVVTCQLWFIRT
jgi:hypothetical protein